MSGSRQSESGGTFEGVVFITGGARGIGAACARVFCEAGATVVFCDVQDGTGYAEELTRRGPGRCSFRQCDVSSPTALTEAIAATVRAHDRLDCLINNAARSLGWRKIDDTSVQEFRDLWETNVLSCFVAAQAALPFLREQKGTIINISSIAAEVGAWRNSAYAATKGAVSSLTKALAIEEAENGVRVNAVAPGIVDTAAQLAARQEAGDPEEFWSFLEGLNWLGRSGMPEEVARVCLFLSSNAASFITGVVLHATGGLELGFGTKRHVPR